MEAGGPVSSNLDFDHDSDMPRWSDGQHLSDLKSVSQSIVKSKHDGFLASWDDQGNSKSFMMGGWAQMFTGNE